MIPIKPSQKLLLLPMSMTLLGLIALLLVGLSFFIKVILLIILLGYVFFQTLSLMQLHPRVLVAFAFPKEGEPLWQLKLKTGRLLKAELLASTRISANVIILHFKVEHATMRFYQIILPDMIGVKNFQDLLVHLKTQ